jgi:nicotinamidase-related amidase
MIQVHADPRPFPHGGVKPADLAVIMIDMQRDFLEPNGYLAAMGYDVGEVRSAIQPASRLLDLARGAKLTVIHTRQGFRPDLAEVPAHTLARIKAGTSAIGKAGPLGRFLIRGERGFEIIPELQPLESEFVVDKSGNGAFWGTDLASILAANEIHSLILAGVTTEVCVHSTLREAIDRGFECLVVSDACASGDPKAHRAALDMVVVEDGVFGVVADIEAVDKALSQV